MLRRFLIFMFFSIFIVACTTQKNPDFIKDKNTEVLYILPDGKMEFKGRLVDEKSVVIYKDGRGGERAAIKIMLPLHSDAYRDTIQVERVEINVPVTRK